MSTKYVVETESGSLYKIEDESHMFDYDRWILYRNQKKYPIIAIAQFKTRKGALAALDQALQEADSPKEYFVIAEETIGESLQSKKCLKSVVCYTDEKFFQGMVQYIKAKHFPRYREIFEAILSQNENKCISFTSSIKNVFIEL